MKAHRASASRSTPRGPPPRPRRCGMPKKIRMVRCFGRTAGWGTWSPAAPTVSVCCRWRGWFMTRPRRAAADLARPSAMGPNSDIENLELEHWRVSKLHRMITRSCIALDPPIDASGLDRVLYRAGPPSRPPRLQWLLGYSEYQVRSLRGL